MWRERGFLNEKFTMLQGLDIPEGPYRVHRIGNCLKCLGSKATLMPSLIVCVRGQFQMKADGFYHWGWTLQGLRVLGISGLE